MDYPLTILIGVGMVDQYDTGDLATARLSWRQALDILTELDHPSAKRVRAKLARS